MLILYSHNTSQLDGELGLGLRVSRRAQTEQTIAIAVAVICALLALPFVLLLRRSRRLLRDSQGRKQAVHQAYFLQLQRLATSFFSRSSSSLHGTKRKKHAFLQLPPNLGGVEAAVSISQESTKGRAEERQGCADADARIVA